MPSEVAVLCLECLSAAAIEWRTIITFPYLAAPASSTLLGFVLVIGLAAVALARGAGGVTARPLYVDLTHPIPTFESLAEKPWEPDLRKPLGDSKAIPSFFRQAVLERSAARLEVRRKCH